MSKRCLSLIVSVQQTHMKYHQQGEFLRNGIVFCTLNGYFWLYYHLFFPASLGYSNRLARGELNCASFPLNDISYRVLQKFYRAVKQYMFALYSHEPCNHPIYGSHSKRILASYWQELRLQAASIFSIKDNSNVWMERSLVLQQVVADFGTSKEWKCFKST